MDLNELIQSLFYKAFTVKYLVWGEKFKQCFKIWVIDFIYIMAWAHLIIKRNGFAVMDFKSIL